MQRKRDGLVPIGEVFGGLDGPVKAIRDARIKAMHVGRKKQSNLSVRVSLHAP